MAFLLTGHGYGVAGGGPGIISANKAHNAAVAPAWGSTSNCLSSGNRTCIDKEKSLNFDYFFVQR